jgi:hypothetical protein
VGDVLDDAVDDDLGGAPKCEANAASRDATAAPPTILGCESEGPVWESANRGGRRAPSRGRALACAITKHPPRVDIAVGHRDINTRGASGGHASIKSDVFYTAVRRHTGMGYRLMKTKIQCFA